jgi:hypothetical protein
MKTAYALPNPQSSSSVANFGAINCTTMKRHFTFGLFFCLACTISFGQVVLNSGFTSGTANWGCTPETNPESVYGGPTANTVAEIDVLVGLCQTINGLVPGTVYNLNYVASRRLGGCPGPNPATIGVTIANLNTTDSRTNTVWALSPSTFLFTATATSHTLNIFHQFVVNTTCGFIIDDITVTVAVPFPVTLTNFDVTESVNGQANISWTTAEEADALTFVVTKSLDLQQWLPVAEIPAMGNAGSYEVQDWPTAGDMTYYRLQGIDANGQVQDLGTRSILARKIIQAGRQSESLYGSLLHRLSRNWRRQDLADGWSGADGPARFFVTTRKPRLSGFAGMPAGDLFLADFGRWEGLCLSGGFGWGLRLRGVGAWPAKRGPADTSMLPISRQTYPSSQPQHHIHPHHGLREHDPLVGIVVGIGPIRFDAVIAK